MIRPIRSALALAVVMALLAVGAHAADSDRPRGYLHFGSGEFNTAWDVHDYVHISLGMNFDRHWGAELAGDVFERYRDYGEVSINTVVPQLRYRYPLLERRLVPYVIVGAGAGFLQFNDARGEAVGQDVHAESWGAAASAGAGIEFFVTDSIAFTVEGKYLWTESMDVRVGSRNTTVDPSAFLATIGLRAYFSQNNPRPLVVHGDDTRLRMAFGVRYGTAILADDYIGKGLRLKPEAGAYGDALNQAAGITISADFREHFGVDLQLGGFEPHLALNGTGNIGEYATFSVLPMARLRMPLAGGRLVPYLTAGVGTMYAEHNDGNQMVDVFAKGFYPVAAAGGGFEYFIHRSVSLTLDAWWQNTWGHRFEIDGQNVEGNFSAIQFQLGFRLYIFDPRKKSGS